MTRSNICRAVLILAICAVIMKISNRYGSDSDHNRLDVRNPTENRANVTGEIRKSGTQYTCCFSFTEEGKQFLSQSWSTWPEGRAIKCTLLYRGVEISLGRLHGDLILNSTASDYNCLQIPSQYIYLLVNDERYPTFVNNLRNDPAKIEQKIAEATELVRGIPTPGATREDILSFVTTFLESAYLFEKPLPHVEIGSARGFSGALTAAVAHLLNFPKNSSVVMISPQVINESPAIFHETVAKLGIQDRVTWFNGTNTDVPWTFGPVRSVYEDSGHNYATTSQSAMLFNRWLVEGGLVAFHDMRCPRNFEGLLWAFDLVLESGNWKEVVFPLKNTGSCKCTARQEIFSGCNYIRVLQKRVTQPPLGIKITVEGNPDSTTFLGEGAATQYNELASFKFYQDFWNNV